MAEPVKLSARVRADNALLELLDATEELETVADDLSSEDDVEVSEGIQSIINRLGYLQIILDGK